MSVVPIWITSAGTDPSQRTPPPQTGRDSQLFTAMRLLALVVHHEISSNYQVRLQGAILAIRTLKKAKSNAKLT
jgi:hypothetical protein